METQGPVMTAGAGTHPGSRGSPQQLRTRVVPLPHSPGSSGTSASSLTGEGFEPHNYAVQPGQQGQPRQTTSKAHSVEILENFTVLCTGRSCSCLS